MEHLISLKEAAAGCPANRTSRHSTGGDCVGYAGFASKRFSSVVAAWSTLDQLTDSSRQSPRLLMASR